jgi:photosystem II stability/assembly factor-like uncharacterized protein
MRLLYRLTVRVSLALLAIFASPSPSNGQVLTRSPDPAVATSQTAAEPTPEQDDATLHDVAFAGTRLGIAVGDRGTVWRTTDGGKTWQFIAVPTSLSLRSVCLVTDRVGWIGGGELDPRTGDSLGVVLATVDGGQTWQRVDVTPLPALATIQFFDAESGCAAAAASPRAPSGVYLTSDGGATWTCAPGPTGGNWSHACFRDVDRGTLVGPRGLQGTFADGALLPVRSPTSLRGLYDVTIDLSGRGWLVGDGGYLRRTVDGGVSWPEPDGTPPFEVRSWQDFRAVAHSGSRVWATGSPGSVVWHSADDGVTWQAQPTGNAAPIEALAFPTPTLGCAVGAFGSIRLTTDGGQTWRDARGSRRRAALLAVHAQADGPSPRLLALQSAEYGYRSAAVVIARRDAGVDAAGNRDEAALLRARLVACGANEAVVNWRLPETLPDLSLDRTRLIDEWSQLTEQKLEETLIGGLVLAIRTWRPDVIVGDDPAANSQREALLAEVLPLAVAQAADPAAYPRQLSLLGLRPWRVSKVFLRSQPDAVGVTLNPQQVLPRLRMTLEDAAQRAEPTNTRSGSIAVRETFVLANHTSDSTAELPPGWDRGFFAGLSIPAGGDARRLQGALTVVDDEHLARLAREQRNFARYAAQMLDDPRHAGQLGAQLRSVTGELPPEQAARLLWNLAAEHQRRSQWDEYEAVLTELVERYPEQPEAQHAMRRLLATWVSRELLWQRLKEIDSSAPRTIVDGNVLQANFGQALESLQTAENAADLQSRVQALPDGVQSTENPGSVRMGDLQALLHVGANNVRGSPVPAGANQQQLEFERRTLQARRVAEALSRYAPRRFAEADVQFLLAAHHRSLQQATAATGIYSSFFGVEGGADPWHLAARGELWIATRGALSPKPVLRCGRAGTPPVLDGRLDDACWHSATAATLTAPDRRDAGTSESTFVGPRRIDGAGRDDSTSPGATIRLCYDDQYLYLSAETPHDSEGVRAPIALAGRVHDADLATFDRLRWTFDVDRDYATWYEFQVDQRGATREALWDNAHWNPKWHVAVAGDESNWRVEAAIPLAELVPTPPARGDVWAGGLTRIVPSRGVEGWTQPAELSIRPETFGLIQFD